MILLYGGNDDFQGIADSSFQHLGPPPPPYPSLPPSSPDGLPQLPNGTLPDAELDEDLTESFKSVSFSGTRHSAFF